MHSLHARNLGFYAGIFSFSMTAETQLFDREFRLRVSGRYHLIAPPGGEGSGRKWPLLIYLHGMGGADEVQATGPQVWQPHPEKFGCILCLPLSTDTRWPTDMVLGLIQHLIATQPVDLHRIYLTGVSIGGLATWELALRRPALFAAIVPLCGAGQPWNAYRIAHVPCWAFHGERDDIVPVKETEAMVKELVDSDGQPRLTILKDVGHSIAELVYRKEELWDWLFAQRNPRPDQGMT